MNGLTEYLVDTEVCNDHGHVEDAEQAIRVAKQKIQNRLMGFPVAFSLHSIAVFPLLGVGYRVPVKVKTERTCLQMLRYRLKGIPVHVLRPAKSEEFELKHRTRAPKITF